MAPEVRGSLPAADGERHSIYTRLVQACEAQAARCGWRGIFSHSNDTSAARHARFGWLTVWRAPYVTFPPDIVTNRQAAGQLSVCYHRLGA